jgi:hypothetical protein
LQPETGTTQTSLTTAIAGNRINYRFSGAQVIFSHVRSLRVMMNNNTQVYENSKLRRAYTRILGEVAQFLLNFITTQVTGTFLLWQTR